MCVCVSVVLSIISLLVCESVCLCVCVRARARGLILSRSSFSVSVSVFHKETEFKIQDFFLVSLSFFLSLPCACAKMHTCVCANVFLTCF